MDLDPARLVLEAFEREGVEHAVLGAVALNIHGLARATVNVVSPSTLDRMKKDTVRAKDRADAEMLRRRFRLGDG